MVANKSVSPAGSLKGYSLSAWFIKNKDTFKYLLMGISAILANMSTNNIAPIWSWSITIASPIVIKLAIDALDFFGSEVKLS